MCCFICDDFIYAKRKKFFFVLTELRELIRNRISILNIVNIKQDGTNNYQESNNGPQIKSRGDDNLS